MYFLKPEEKIRTTEGEGDLSSGKWAYCFNPSDRLKELLPATREDRSVACFITTLTLTKPAFVKTFFPEIEKFLQEEPSFEQKTYGIKKEVGMSPMDEAVVGRITSLHTWYGGTSFGDPSTHILVFIESKAGKLTPLIMQYSEREKKCLGDIVQNGEEVPAGTKILIPRN